MSIVYIIIGAILVLWGADRLTDGATAIAQRLNIPQIVIGLTVVAMGTGSNVFNTMAIVGITALVAPMTISRSTVQKDIPFAIVASVMLLLMCFDTTLSRLEAGVLFLGFLIFMVYTVRIGMKNGDEQVLNLRPMPVWQMIGLLLLGMACLIGGSDLFVIGAKSVAKTLGVSDAVIGLTIVACGTSLPELATSIVAARKGRSAIAIGNVIGSNVFNTMAIVGITALVAPCPGHRLLRLYGLDRHQGIKSPAPRKISHQNTHSNEKEYTSPGPYDPCPRPVEDAGQGLHDCHRHQRDSHRV